MVVKIVKTLKNFLKIKIQIKKWREKIPRPGKITQKKSGAKQMAGKSF